MAALEKPGTASSLKFLAALVPMTCGLLGALVANIPLSLSAGALPPPLLALVPVYFWCLVRPDLMTPAVTLVIGFAEDVLSGGPPGVWTLAFVLTYALVARQRDSFAGLSGFAAVLGFAAAASICCACAYFTVAALHGHLPPLAPVLSALAMTVLFYIPTAFVIGSLHRRLVGASRGDL